MKNHKDKIIVKGARQHNLKNIDIEIPRNKLVVVTGLSGSGKSSLAFDTIYAEGQRRYVESLSSYARQFLGLMEKPDVDVIEGLSPAISIEQKTSLRNPRSTVGTVTEIHDYLRLLFTHIGKPYCWKCGSLVKKQTVQQIVDTIKKLKNGAKILIMAPIIRGRKGQHKAVFDKVRKDGFLRVRVDGKVYNIEQNIKLNKNKTHDIEVVIDRLILKKESNDRITESVELAINIGSGLVLVKEIDGGEYIFSEHLSCPDCKINIEEITPRMFSFNSPYGACEKCDGIGSNMEVDPNLVIPDKTKSLIQGAIAPLGEQPRGNWYGNILKSLSSHINLNFSTSWIKLEPKIRQILLFGTGEEKYKLDYSSERWSGSYLGGWEGVIPNLIRRYNQTNSSRVRAWIEQYMSMRPCQGCNGDRLKKESLAIRINKTNIGSVSSMSVKKAKLFFDQIALTKTEYKIAQQILNEISQRLSFLINVGLEYLTLNRSAMTLSGGEAQRIRLASQIGSQLVGVLYVLDEPSIGLHPRDNTRLLQTLKSLRDIGNSILVVEHDKETIEAADYIIDIGPGAGRFGGEVTFSGAPSKLKNAKRSLTAKYIEGKKKILIPKKRRHKVSKFLKIRGACGNNLQSINVDFPLGQFITVTGVSGSGKSTLINETLFPALRKKLTSVPSYPLKYESIEGIELLDKVINIDQKPIGRTPRSNPATYTGVFTHIRDLFAQLPDSKIRGYKPGRFSFNVKGGRCESCEGDGIIKIVMNFLPDVYVKCEVCQGRRYNRETLEIKYRLNSIADILNMQVNDALKFFSSILPIQKRLQTLSDVGLGYIQLGQQATTLSGGEAQRIKLSTELSKTATSKTVYILDEPTTGLHFEDIKMLLSVLQVLVNRGNTVIVIEHNMDVIKSSDFIIDLGPEGGNGGGCVVATGDPEYISEVKGSYTGLFLKKVLKKN